MIPHPLTNFEIEAYYRNKFRFNGVFSRDNLHDKIKNWSICNKSLLYMVSLYVNNKTVTYFDSFGVEQIPKEIKKFINNKNIIATIYRIQNYDSIMCGYFCIGFINYMFQGKSLTDFTNVFSPNDFKKNNDIILNYFLNKL